jgi:hypothetical protein
MVIARFPVDWRQTCAIALWLLIIAVRPGSESWVLSWSGALLVYLVLDALRRRRSKKDLE